MWQRESDDAHQEAVTVGRIDTITPDLVTGMVNATGVLLDPDIFDEVAQVAELIRNRIVGPSMDAGACEVEWMVTGGGEGYYDNGGWNEPKPYSELCMFTRYECAGVTLVSIPAFSDVSIELGGPESVTAAVRSSGWSSMPVADLDTAWSGSGAAGRVFDWATSGDSTDWGKYAKAFLWKDDDADPETKGAYKLGVADVIGGQLEIVPKAVYAVAGVLNGARGGTTIPEADQAKLKSVVSGLYRKIAKAAGDKTIMAPWDSMSASAAPALPPLGWFTDPHLEGPTPVTITADGQVFGHAALWETCHVGMPGCVTAPVSMSNYAYFTVGATLTDAGEIPTGKLTVGGGHADGELGFTAASEHYDNVGTAVATVTAGEDEHGIWVAGALLPGATDAQVEALRQSPLSGDWRRIGGNLELVAAHAVNVPGFPVPRPRAVVASGGEQLSLVASARFPEAKPAAPVIDQKLLALDIAEALIAAGLRDPEPVVVPSVDLQVDDGERRRASARLAMIREGV
jgi:hypothetical protein